MQNSTRSVSTPVYPIVLASASSRRLHLLEQIGVVPVRIVHPKIDETPQVKELPGHYVKRLALEKLSAGQELAHNAQYILAADTIAVAGKRILNKPHDVTNAEKQLRLLSGRRHRVYTALALFNAQNKKISFRLVCTTVCFSRLSEQQLAVYLQTNEWQGKTGAYAIQGQAASFIKSIKGSYSNVVGLPLFETAQLLRGQGLLP